MAFVFQKVAKPEDAKAPALPPPERKPAGAGAGQGGRAGGVQGQRQGGWGGNKVRLGLAGVLCWGHFVLVCARSSGSW